MFLGTITICFALAMPDGGVEAVKCYAEKPVKFETGEKCREGLTLYLNMAGGAMVRMNAKQYAEDKPWKGKRRLLYRFKLKCKRAV